jgi:cytochrome c oxidase cbb3-type subunit 3
VAALPEGPYAGIGVSVLETTTNPLGRDPKAIAAGDSLFEAVNCSGCHGQDAKTGIFAPNLIDAAWRYGGSDADVYNSIYEGRARGMPAWGGMLSPTEIWEIVAYIRSLGGMQGARLPGAPTPATDTVGANAKTPANKRQP